MAKKIPPKVHLDPDSKLLYHLERGEEHLIEAAKLFLKKEPPKRHPDYVRRLNRAQETVTSLTREELVRKRGPIRVVRRSK